MTFLLQGPSPMQEGWGGDLFVSCPGRAATLLRCCAEPGPTRTIALSVTWAPALQCTASDDASHRRERCAASGARECSLQTHQLILAAHFARALLSVTPSSIKRAQGRPGAGWHPRSAARTSKRAKEPHSSIQVTPEHPAFPAQWVDGLCRALPGAKLPSGLPHPPN